MRSSRALIFAGSILLLGSLSLGQTGTVPANRSRFPIVQTDSPVTRDCKEADWSLLETPAAKDLLSDYDFDPFLPGSASCGCEVAAFGPNSATRRGNDWSR